MAEVLGGDNIKREIDDIARKMSQQSRSVKVGFLENRTYPSGESVPLVAMMNEYGTGRQPPRPFFRTMVEANKDGWSPRATELLVANDYNVERTLAQMGALIAGQLAEAITAFSGAPLAPSTIRRKGFEKALIDTGVMINSISFKVG